MSNIQSFWESFFPPTRWRTKPVDVVKDEEERIADMAMKILVGLLVGSKETEAETVGDYIRLSYGLAELMFKEHKKRIEQKLGAK